MLGIAYAASVGSLATIIGTPPNTLLVGYLQDAHGIQRINELAGGRKLFDDELAKLGTLSSGERRVAMIFALAALSWITLPLIWDDPPTSDAGIAIAAGLLFLTELTSNTATAATFLPVIGGVAMGIGQDPLLLTIPVALAATSAFMLPVATPPNAIVFGTGYVSIGSMVKGGIWLNIIAILIISVASTTLAVRVFDIAM